MMIRGRSRLFAVLAVFALAACDAEPEDTLDEGGLEEEWQEKDPIANVTYTTATSPYATTTTKEFASVFTAVGSRTCYARDMGEYCEVGTETYTGSPAQSGIRIDAQCTGGAYLGSWTTSTSPIVRPCDCKRVRCWVRVENP